VSAAQQLRNLHEQMTPFWRTEDATALIAALPVLADALEAAERETEPLYDETFRGRLLRQGLSHDEMRDHVDAIESSQERVRRALAAVDAALNPKEERWAPRGTPPPTVSMRWCHKCGRDDRFTMMKDKHYTGGKRCAGTPVTVTYVWIKEWRKEQP
jgi:hypothetical protein